MAGSAEALFYGFVLFTAVVVFLRLVGKEKAHLDRLVLLRQLSAEKKARAIALRKKLEAENASDGS
jgi:hypothetical protein